MDIICLQIIMMVSLVEESVFMQLGRKFLVVVIQSRLHLSVMLLVVVEARCRSGW